MDRNVNKEKAEKILDKFISELLNGEQLDIGGMSCEPEYFGFTESNVEKLFQEYPIRKVDVYSSDIPITISSIILD